MCVVFPIVNGPFAGTVTAELSDSLYIWVPCGPSGDRFLPIPHKREVGYGGHYYYRVCYTTCS